jgi:hypothetical protein
MSDKMLLIGDVHGLWTQYAHILDVVRPDRSVQLGDFGIGFANEDPEALAHVHEVMDTRGGSNRYIRGNHDNPQACEADPRWIPDATVDEQYGIFYMGGALSIDREWRISGRSWWPDEELSHSELFDAMDVYEQTKPRIVFTHECPEDVVPYLFNWYKRELPSRTRQALGSMWSIHQPELHVFGHWHSHIDVTIGRTRFVCLDELQAATLDLNTLDLRISG